MRTGSEGPGRTEDELRAALLMLERHAPSADAVLRAVRAVGRSGRAPGLVRRATSPRRWSGWLAPLVAAAAVVGVIVASLAISGAILRHPAGTGTVFAKVPPYFVAVPDPVSPGRAVVGATATGAVLGTVAPPRPHTEFKGVAAAGDGRTFVLAAGGLPKAGTNALDGGPVRFYRLVLDRSGHPGRLAALPMPPQTATITGLALSPDGSKLAVALLPVHGRAGPKIQVSSVATGAGREWVWPGTGWIGEINISLIASGQLSWAADNRTLLFEQTTSTAATLIPQLRLLDTAAPGSSLLASSTRVPIPSAQLGPATKDSRKVPFRIPVMPLMTGDGTKLVAVTYYQAAPPKKLGFTITEFSVRTGKPVRVLHRQRAASDANSPAVQWVNTSGTAMIAVRTVPGQNSHARGSAYGVQTPTTFTPLPPSTQRLFFRHGEQFLLPVW